MKFRSLLILFGLATSWVFSQAGDALPRGYFTSPLDTTLNLKGSFGEIRPDHFHSGLDLSTGEREGMPVLAVADGYVSRIKVSATGFGKALYITHPNGFVSVYAHLKSFDPAIEKFARKEQEEKQSFEIDFKPEPKKLKVRKGKPIASSGNSGSSEGPHLHFEIRDEKSEDPLNPLLFGLQVKDTIPPILRSLRVFPKALNGIVELSDAPVSYPLVYSDGSYYVDLPDYVKVYGTIAFGLEAVDFANNSSSELGIYSVSLMSDSQPVYALKMDRFNFSYSRTANACIDYAWRYEEGKTVYRCFKLPGPLALAPIESVNESNGYLQFDDESSHYLVFKVTDFAGNTAELKINVRSMKTYGTARYRFPPSDHVRLSPAQGAAIHKSYSEVIVLKNTVYDTYYLTVKEEMPGDDGFYSRLVTVGDPSEPLNESISVGLRSQHLPDSLKTKAVVVRIDSFDQYTSLGGNWNENFLVAKTRQFGRFVMMIDTLPPVIKPITVNKLGDFPSVLEFQISDNLSGIQSYRAELNGRWLLTEYDAKSGVLRCELDPEELKELIEANEMITFQLTVTDNRLNSVRTGQGTLPEVY
jgi:Peptidase family M23